MAKEKAKHDGLLCFLLALIVVLILVIGGGAYYFLVVDNGEKNANNESENNSIPTNTENNIEKQENKLVNLSEEEKKAINKKIDTVEMVYMLNYTNDADKKLTEKDMVNISVFWSMDKDADYDEYVIYDMELDAHKVNIEYAKKWVKKVFNKDINVESIEDIKKSDKDLLITDFPTGFGIQVHKVQKLELNEKTNTYSLYIDELNLTEIEDNDEFVEKLEEIRAQTNYSEYKVANSYVLRYKEVNGEKYIVDIVKNTVADVKDENSIETTKELSQTELKELKTYIINNDLEHFLIEDYEDVREAILDEGILYSFIVQNGKSLSSTELIEYYGFVPDAGSTYKIDKSKVEDFLKKSTGYSLTEFKNGKDLGKNELHRIRYSEKDNSYYMATAGALGPISGELISIEKDGNKYTLNYQKSVLTLNKVETSYLVVSHILKK